MEGLCTGAGQGGGADRWRGPWALARGQRCSCPRPQGKGRERPWGGAPDEAQQSGSREKMGPSPQIPVSSHQCLSSSPPRPRPPACGPEQPLSAIWGAGSVSPSQGRQRMDLGVGMEFPVLFLFCFA